VPTAEPRFVLAVVSNAAGIHSAVSATTTTSRTLACGSLFRPNVTPSQAACRYGTVIGTNRSFQRLDGLRDKRPNPVRLRGGIKGFFYDTVCTVFCSDSYVAWSEGKYHYVIGLKAAIYNSKGKGHAGRGSKG
jgi:hypothetical protein